jgi:hypothetical protein
VYLNIPTLDWCEPCLWNFVREDQPSPRDVARQSKAALLFEREQLQRKQLEQNARHYQRKWSAQRGTSTN